MATRAEKKLQTWRTIRAAALRLFEQQGYTETTIDQIALAAGVSRGTYFNYFAGKEAVVVDPDPEDRVRWRAAMDDHVRDDAWSAVSAIMLDVVELLRDRMDLLRRLKQADPAMHEVTQAFGDLLRSDLDDWARRRQDAVERGGITMALYVNLAYACATTAYEAWQWEEPFDAFLDHLRNCLRLAEPRPSRPQDAEPHP